MSTQLNWKASLYRALGLMFVFALISANVAQAELTERQRKMSHEVFERLLAVIPKPERWDVWPPRLDLVDSDLANASAGPRTEDGKTIPVVTLYRGEIELVAQNDPDALAFTLGHELGHLIHYHSFNHRDIDRRLGGQAVPIVTAAFTRDQELQADTTGYHIALKAGFSVKGLKINLQNSRARNAYCGIQGLTGSHPSWDERIAIVQDDATQQNLWRTMTAFDNGVFLLGTQQYAHAAICFRRVVDEFPGCYEAWANLGYAQLMQYCDALESDDLKAFDIGPLVLGGFFKRPESLEAQVRGIDEDLWFDAVGALREAIRLGEGLKTKNPMIFAKANLAVAYLVRPAGKDIGQAERLFTEVLELLEKPEHAKSIDAATEVAIYINAAAGRRLQPQLAAATQRLAKFERNEYSQTRVKAMSVALGYQRAMELMKSPNEQNKADAFTLFESYLTSMRRAGAWWPLAYAQYVELAKALGRTAKAESEFSRGPKSTMWRPVTLVSMGENRSANLGEETAILVKRLGEPEATIPVVKGTNLKLLKYPKLGVSVLATHVVVAILVDTPNSPAIPLQRFELGGESKQLKIGMTRKEIEALLGDDWDSIQGPVYDPEVSFRIYREAGIAVRYHEGKVAEFAVVVVPVSNSSR